MTPVALVRDTPAAALGVVACGIVDPVVVRRARPEDVPGIAALVAEWAEEGLLLRRSAADVAAALSDYVVAADATGHVLACAALREYAPSLAELVSVAVARAAHGRGLGAQVVRTVEALARSRGHAGVFAHTRNPEFFAAVGYDAVDRALYPEKRGRPQSVCVRRQFGSTAEADVVIAAPVTRDAARRAA